MAHVTVGDDDIYVLFQPSTLTSDFEIDFAVWAKSEIRVRVDGEDLTQSDFAFAENGLPTITGGYQGGVVTLNTAVDDVDVEIWRDISPSRATDIDAGAFDFTALNTEFDKLVAVAQDLKRDIARAPKMPFGEEGREIEDPTGHDGKGLSYDAATDSFVWSDFQGEQGEVGPQGPAGPSGSGTGDVLAANNGTEFTAATFRSNLAIAPADAVYIVQTLTSGLSAERAATNTTDIEWDFGTAAAAKLNLASSRIATAANIRAGTAAKLVEADDIVSALAAVTLADGATVTVDFSAGINFKLTMEGSRTITFSNASSFKGRSGCIEITQDATGSRVATWNGNYEFAGGTDIVLTTAANARDYIFYYIGDNGKPFLSAQKDVKN